MVVPDAKVKDLIDFINNNNPTTYDYPVPDAIAIPISTGNKEFLTWAKDAKKIDFGKIYPKTTPYGWFIIGDFWYAKKLFKLLSNNKLNSLIFKF